MRYGNPFFNDPGIGRGFSNLASVFMPDPERESRSLVQQAQARLYGSQANEIDARIAANPEAADAIARGDYAGAFAAWARGGSAPVMQAAPGFVRGVGAVSGMPDSQLSRLYTDYGNSPEGFGRTLAETARNHDLQSGDRRYGTDVGAATQRRGQDIGSADRRYDTDQDRAGAMDRARLDEEGRDRRFSVSPNANERVIVPPNSPVAPAGSTAPVTLEGVRTETGAGRAPLDVGGSDLTAIETALQGELDAAFGNTPAVEPAARQWLSRRAAELYQQSRNMAGAVAQAVREFQNAAPQRTDSRLNPFSNQTYGLPPSLSGGGAPAVVDTPQQGAAAAVPPPAQRVPGQVYQTPRGPMIWTGTGWRPGA